MNLLFIDTETSGLDPFSAEIIEIGAILCELNPVTLKTTLIKQFESLVKPSTSLDPKITRITGISQEELTVAPSRFEVQNKWNEWLDDYTDSTTALIGHSIFFDKGFLDTGGWTLPSTQIIDTLDICKILYPYLSAVNLEHLIQTLDVTPEKLYRDLNINLNHSHRALYDCFSCLGVFEYSLQKLAELKAPQEFYSVLTKTFLPIPLTFYSSSQTFDDSISQKSADDSVNNQNTVTIHLQGEKPHFTLSDMISKEVTHEIYQKCVQILDLKWSKDYSRTLCQIFVVLHLRLINKMKSIMRIHGRFKKEFKFAQIIFHWLNDIQDESNNSQHVTYCELEYLLTHIKDIVEHSIQLGDIAEMADITQEILTAYELDIPIKSELSSLSTKYDFLYSGIIIHFVGSELHYNPYNHTNFPDPILIKKTFELIHDINETKINLSTLNTPRNQLTGFVVELFSKYVEISTPPNNSPLFFRRYKEQLTLHWRVSNPSLNKFFTNVFQRFESVTIPTYSPLENGEKAAAILELSSFKTCVTPKIVSYYSAYQLQIEKNINLREYFSNLLETTQHSSKPALILCGQNSAIRDSERIIVENFSPQSYLILGESGSLAKIGSKLTRGFSGLFVSKVGDFEYLRKLNLPELSRVVFLSEPYVYIHAYLIETKSEEEIQELKVFYRNAIFSKIHSKVKTETVFIPSYR